MMKRNHSSLLVFLMLSLQQLLFSPVCAFVVPLVFATATRRQLSLDASSAGDNDDDDDDYNNAASDGNMNNKKPMAGVHPRKESQELLMEVLSARGAERIAQLSVPERAKRALLAEAVEDQIFANTEELERIMLQEEADDDGTRLPMEQRRQAVVEIASQTKTLQVQYQELVSGESSSVLNAMEAAFGGEGGSSKSESHRSSSTGTTTKKDENAADDDPKDDGGERAD